MPYARHYVAIHTKTGNRWLFQQLIIAPKQNLSKKFFVVFEIFVTCRDRQNSREKIGIPPPLIGIRQVATNFFLIILPLPRECMKGFRESVIHLTRTLGLDGSELSVCQIPKRDITAKRVYMTKKLKTSAEGRRCQFPNCQRLLSEPLAKPSEMQQANPVADLSESFTIHALI